MKIIPNDGIRTGEAGPHKSHKLELLVSGVVYCSTCGRHLSFKAAEKAWPEENKSIKSEVQRG